MNVKSNVRFHNMESSPALAAKIQKNISKLQHFYAHIIALDVTVEAPHHHQHKGSSYRVVIKVAVPGETLVVGQISGNDPAHEDCYVAIRDAFRSARRQLQDHARIRRHQVKRHEQKARRGSVSEAPTDADPDTDASIGR